MEQNEQNEKEQIKNYEAAIEEGKHSMRRKQKERYVRKKRKRLKRLKSFLRFILFVLLVTGAYFFVKLPQWYLAPDTFSAPNENNIEIINNYLVPKQTIYNSLKNIKVVHVPIFMMGVKDIKRELFKIPVIKNVYIRRYGFPARIQIIIRERIPALVIKTDLNAKPVSFITTDGIWVTDKIYMPLSESGSALKILTKDVKQVKDWDVKRIDNIEKIVKAVEAYSSEKVQYIDMRDPNDVYVKIESTNIRLGVLDSLVFERIKRIYTILPQISEVDGEVKYVDLSWDKVNYFKLKQKEDEAKDKPQEPEE